MNDAQRVVDSPAAGAGPNPAGSDNLATPARARRWEVKIWGRKLGTMWGIFAILGATFISLIGTPAEVANPFLKILRLSIPVVLMGIYAWYGYRYAESAGDLVALRSARVGQLADSLYFLGFLWTLWALIDSFVIHVMSIPEAAFRAFGYALVTTATGMFLRLLLLQFGYSAEDQVRLGERTVEEEIGRFTKEMTTAAASISGFRTETDIALTGWIDSLNKSTGALKGAVDDVKAQTTNVKDILVAIHKASIEHVDRFLETALRQFIANVEPSLTGLNEANKQFVTEVNASAKALKDELQNKTAELMQRLRSSTAKVETAVGVGIKHIDAAVQAVATQMQPEFLRAADAISAGLVRSAQTIDMAGAAFATSLSEQMASFESSLNNVSKQIREIRVPADIVEKTVGQQTATVNASLVTSARALQDAIEKLGRTVVTVAEQMHRERSRPWWKLWA